MRVLNLLKTSIALIIGWLVWGSAYADEQLSSINMTSGVTPVSRDIYDLHMTIFWICVAIGVVVFSVMFFTLFRHRKSRGVKPATFHEHPKLEIIWAIIPVLILIAMAIPATRVLMRMSDTSDATVNIKVTGYQWKWKYEYLDEGISFFSNLSTPLTQIQNRAPKDKWYLLEVDRPLVLPIHEKIRFLVTSNDVIHSWWVPALGIKRDAMPGFIYESWARIDKPGIYRGQCAELCGINHGYMPIVIEAVTQEEYKKWLAQQSKGLAEQQAQAQAAVSKPWAKADLLKNGEEVYNSRCAVCHKPEGNGMPPAFPALRGNDVATGFVSKHINIVLNGKQGTAMQAFGPQLNDADIASVITYERTSWGNDKLLAAKAAQNKDKAQDYSNVVQPSEVAAARNGQ